MQNSESKAWLEREDQVCREDRLARLNWVANLMPTCEYLIFPGGWMAKHLFEEARYCFVYGQFLATIVLGTAYVERTLAALLYAAGRSDLERAGISVLLCKAVELGWLAESDFKNLDHARVLRNTVAHFRAPGDGNSVEFRSATHDEQPYAIMEEDARHVMEAAFCLLARRAV